MLKGNNKYQLDLHVSRMKYTGLNDVVDQLQGCVKGTCPSREGILGAMAADIGKASGNDLERVCTVLMKYPRSRLDASHVLFTRS